jgi:putative DNA primase/helicase
MADKTSQHASENKPVTATDAVSRASLLPPQRAITVPSIVSYSPPVPPAATDPHRLAGVYLMNRCMSGLDSTLYYWRGEHWRWDGRKYKKVSIQQLRAEVTQEVKLEFNRIAPQQRPPHTKRVVAGMIANVIQAISSMVLVPENEDLPLWIGAAADAKPFVSMANGLLDLEALLSGSGKPLRPHSPNWFSQTSFPYEYAPNATCPTWSRFLDEVLEGDQERISLIQEWFGYCLTPDTSHHKFLVLEGEGANGKSVVCEVLTALLGRDNVSNVPLEIFGERFQLTPTLGKLANIVSEIGDIRRVAEGQLKQFTSGDRMYFDRKGVPGIEAYPTARLLFATNQRPQFADRSSGLWRRMMVVPFRVTIPAERQDKELVSKLVQELPGICLWSVEGLRRLREQGRFIEPALCKEALDEYRLQSNPAREFLSDHYELKADASTVTQEVYEHYANWARNRGYEVLSDSQLGKEIYRAFPQVERKKRGTRGARYSVYTGLVRRPDWVEVDADTVLSIPAPAPMLS